MDRRLDTMNIVDFNNCKENNKAYGGMAGSKLGIIYQDEDWLLKFPKSTKGMKVDHLSYTTSPLSEYIGSQIYEILNYDVHKTVLGIRDKKIVVGCKDFTSSSQQLLEFREIKNYYNRELEEILDHTISDSAGTNSTSLEAIKTHLEYNPLLKQVNGITERFWDCVIIDGLINNNDRNSGNWGILRQHNGKVNLAPIFDNEASFSTKLSEEQVHVRLTSEEKLMNSSINIISGYSLDKKSLKFEALITMTNPNIMNALDRVFPKIHSHWNEIRKVISEIPNMHDGLQIISEERKAFYIRGMEIRMEHILLPAYEQLQREVT